MVPKSLIAQFLLAFIFTVSLALWHSPAHAHRIRPAIVTVTPIDGGRFEIDIVTNLEVLLSGIGPKHDDTDTAPSAMLYNELRALPSAVLKSRFETFAQRWLEEIKIEFNGKRSRPHIVNIDVPAPGDLALARLSTVRLEGHIPPNGHAISWSYPARFGSSVLRVKQTGSEDMVTTWLAAGKSSAPVPLSGATPKSTVEIFIDYVGLGFVHILPEGLDHILFVLGLYLLNTRLKSLLIQVTAFTIAHSITLGLGLYGVVQVSPAIVEPLISASIVYVAVENLITSKLYPWRPLVVFGFGLLHGLGFASVLQEIGLPRADFVTGLIGFNVGVEFGQLGVIGLAWCTTGFWFSTRPWYRARIVIPASAAIAMTGLYWTVERVFMG